MKKKVYSVWVGGGEVNSYYINSEEEANSIADEWRAKGYDDVNVEEYFITPADICFGREDLLSVSETIVTEYGEGDGEELCQKLADCAKEYLESLSSK